MSAAVALKLGEIEEVNPREDAWEVLSQINLSRPRRPDVPCNLFRLMAINEASLSAEVRERGLQALRQRAHPQRRLVLIA